MVARVFIVVKTDRVNGNNDRRNDEYTLWTENNITIGYRIHSQSIKMVNYNGDTDKYLKVHDIRKIGNSIEKH